MTLEEQAREIATKYGAPCQICGYIICECKDIDTRMDSDRYLTSLTAAIVELVQEQVRAARVDERESMMFLGNDGIETNIPFLQYRFKKDGLILNWADRTNELAQQEPEVKHD